MALLNARFSPPKAHKILIDLWIQPTSYVPAFSNVVGNYASYMNHAIIKTASQLSDLIIMLSELHAQNASKVR